MLGKLYKAVKRGKGILDVGCWMLDFGWGKGDTLDIQDFYWILSGGYEEENGFVRFDTEDTKAGIAGKHINRS